MQKPLLPINDSERIQALKSYQVLDTLPERDFDELVELAAKICETPVSLISLVDEDRQWFKSKYGIELTQTIRDYSFCAHAINTPNEPFIIEDARMDSRFCDNPLVTNTPGVIFYAGIPLLSSGGLPLGTVCVIDHKPKKLSTFQIDALKTISNQVSKLLELRLRTMALEQQRDFFKKQSIIYEKTNEVAKTGWWEYNISNKEICISSITKKILEVNEDFILTLENCFHFFKNSESGVNIKNTFKDALKYGTDAEMEVQIITATGRDKWLKIIFKSVINHHKTIRLYGVFQDIDKSKKMTGAFEKTQQKILKDARFYKSIIDNQSFYVVKTDLQGNFIFQNNFFCKRFGIAKDKWIGKKYFELLVPEDRRKCLATLLKCRKKPQKKHKVILRSPTAAGEVVNEWEFQLIINVDGKPEKILCIGHEITELINKQDSLKKLADITADQNMRLMNYTHIISHNLRSHVANLMGLTNLATTWQGKEKEEAWGMVQQSALYLNETINNLNEVISIRSNPNLPLTHVNLKERIQKALESINPNKTIDEEAFHILLDGNEYMKTNRAYLDSFLFNLISNALKYQSPERPPKIEIGLQQQTDHQILFVKDNGLGIDLDKNKEKIFGMYKTFHGNKDAKGLGLFITKNQIEALNGKIEVESEVGIGSTFKIYFYDKN